MLYEQFTKDKHYNIGLKTDLNRLKFKMTHIFSLII